MVQIGELIRGLPVALKQGSLTGSISAIVEDSRRAGKGSLFIARHGTKSDGRGFVADAVSRGAVAVLTDELESLPSDVAGLACDDPAAIGAKLAERFYGNPSQALELIGITGTNGKTTTTYLIQQLLNHAGMRCGLIGTVEIDDGATRSPAELTTPPAIELSRLLRSMVDNGCQACVMEASSHALHQQRTAGLNFHIGVFTNLTGDHLDYHQTMDDYLAAKALLFESLSDDGFAVLNVDDPASRVLKGRTASRVVACSQNDTQSACWAKVRFESLDHTEVVF
ncbi:MAG: UDP-N-acetylmuramyl-tripeptide synthetase, partial [Phycisphaerales bacterium]|nr:UDP-N-acetylmuramyl-tripeptide synthetase [Phycisphaerales bacterium]